MHLVQLLLPARDHEGRPFSTEVQETRRELIDRFGGVTAYTRAPASGAWVADGGNVEHDDIVIVEVMAESLDRGWWRAFAAELARRFGQQELVVRALPLEDLSARR